MITKEQIEEFFISMLEDVSCPSTSYLSMPDNDGFTYCLKEIIHTLQNNINNDLKNNYSRQLIDNFYRYMQKDIVFKEVDTIQYSKLMVNLKLYAEGDKVSKKDQFTYFEHLYRVFGYSYRDKLFKIIKDAYMNPKSQYDYYYNIFKCFINEILASGVNYKYLFYIVGQYRLGKFNSFGEFIEYLHYGNKDSFDIYLPLKNVIEKNIEYLESNGQQICIVNDNYYCKVYSNKCIDFFHVIKQNMTRIEAMFNMLRLYSKSTIDFEIDGEVIIESRFLEEQESIPFLQIISYKGITPYFKHFVVTMESLDKLKDLDKKLYHKVLNVISYAEKDKDICNHSSYVDNWISLETLCSLSGRKTGYESVEFVLPSILAAKMITSNVTNILKNAYTGKHRLKMESFIEKAIKDNIDISTIDNIYYQYCVYKCAETLQDIDRVKKKFGEVEDRIRLDVLRIYMLRNEYVHESNIHAFNSMQQIKLKNLLALALDEFFKILNRRIDSQYSELGLNYEIFTQLLSRSEAREIAFKILLEKNCRVGNNINLATTLENENIDLQQFVLNVLKGNLSLFKQYIPSSDYSIEALIE